MSAAEPRTADGTEAVPPPGEYAMSEKQPLPDRHHPSHFPTHSYGNRACLVFLTVCTHGRQPLLCHPNGHALLRMVWQQQATAWRVGQYTLMPDHLHLFCTPSDIMEPLPLRKWVSFWKSRVAALWPMEGRPPYRSQTNQHPPLPFKLWQRDYWDTQLRHGESYSDKWDYVRNNPVRKGLVGAPEAWPYQGEIFPLTWHGRI